MSEFKFNCPSCGQHLMGDVRYAGMKINCPACSKPVVVPPAPAGVAPAAPTLPSVPSAPPPPRPPSPPPPPTAPRPPAPPAAAPRPPAPLAGAPKAATPKTSGLAIASLICSLATFIGIPFAFVGGIICGHMAKKRIAATPGLGGAGLAKAGLIIGYIALSIYILAVVTLVTIFVFAAKQVRQQMKGSGMNSPSMNFPEGRTRPGRTQPSGRNQQPRQGMPAMEAETTDTKPDGSGWTMNLSGVTIPSTPVAGRIHGQPFKLEKATMENGWLKLSQGKDFFADLEMTVVTFENDNAKLSGRTFTLPKKEFGISPHVMMAWKEAGQNLPNQRTFMQRYTMQLEFGQPSNGKLPGKIYLCVPDKDKSFVAGTFEAELNSR